MALQGGKAPDVTYQYGTNIAQLATSDKIVDLTERVNAPEYDWADFPAGRARRVHRRRQGLRRARARRQPRRRLQQGPVRQGRADGAGARLDVGRAGRRRQGADERGRQAVRARVADRRQSETEVWKYIAMLWEAGGDILTPDGTKTAFASPQGVTALAALRRAGRGQDAATQDTDAGQPEDGAALQRRQDRHVHHGAVAARRLPRRELRRAGDAVVPRRHARDHRRARTPGCWSTTATRRSRPPGPSCSS